MIQNEEFYLYHNEPNGCPSRLLDESGKVVWAARYDAWGKIKRLLVDEVEQPLRLQGQYFDSETGLHYNRFRYYEPRIGAFVSQDPLGLLAGEKVYQLSPNITGWIDPLGLSCKTTRDASWFDEVARRATRNPESDKLVLGHFSCTGTSYQKVAAHYKATYFKVQDWNAVTKGLSQDEIWRINQTFLTQQIKQGKQILFSHNPLMPRPNTFFEREVNFLRDLGYTFKQKNKWTWEAVR